MIFAELSIQDFVDKVGPYVGFVSAIGLALFALLLFAQARELKRLREWGAQAHDRIGELERRLAAALELARRASSSQRTMAPSTRPPAAQRPGGPAVRPAAARAGAPVLARTSSPTRLPLLPAAAVGVGGPSLGSATVLLPLPKHPPGTTPAAAPAPTALPATGVPSSAPAPAPMPAAAPPSPRAPVAMPAAAAAAGDAPTAAPASEAPAPATAAAQGPAQPRPAPTSRPRPAAPAGTNGHSDTFPPVPPVRRPAPPARAGGGRRPVARPAARPGQRPVPAAPLRARGPATATARGSGSGNGAPEAPHGRRRLTWLLAGLGIVALAAIAVVVLTSGGSESPSQAPAVSNGTPAQTSGGSGSSAAPAHGRITVAVLNGTTTVGLAQTVASRLVADGFVEGAVTNASDQGRSVTVVSYFGGREREAQEVAKSLGLPSDAVGPIDADTEQACGQGGACTATVVVTVGADWE